MDPVVIISLGDYMCKKQELATALDLLERVYPIIDNDVLADEVKVFIEAMMENSNDE